MSSVTQPHDIRTLGFVLRRVNYAEADRILDILTPNGKITAIAKSVRKSRSKLAGGVEMFSLVDFQIHLGRGEFGIVTGARMMKYYGKILEDFERMELMGMILRRVDRAADGSSGAGFFEVVKQCLVELNSGANASLVESWFLLNFMKVSGEEANLYRDSEGKKLEENLRYDWDEMNESFVRNEQGEYGADEIKMLRLMTTVELGTVRRVRATDDMYRKISALVRKQAKV